MLLLILTKISQMQKINNGGCFKYLQFMFDNYAIESVDFLEEFQPFREIFSAEVFAIISN